MNIKQVKITGFSGFTLIELMISLVIGLFLMVGVFTVYLNSTVSQRMVQDQIGILDDARFAIETINYDLRHAGMFGRRALVDSHIFSNGAIGGVFGECVPGWASDISIEPLRAFNDATPYLSSCTTDYSHGDVIEMRYTLGAPVLGGLLANTLYLNASINEAQFFIGNASPNLDNALDFQAVAHAYYVSNFTDVAGDGIPALHRVSLQTGASGPEVVDEMLLSGVVDLQVQYGIDHDGRDENGELHLTGYVNPGDPALNGNQVLFAQVWIVVQSTDFQPDLDTSATFIIAGNSVVYPNDGYRKVMLSSVAKMRNL